MWRLKLEDFCQYGPPWYTNVIILVLLVLLVLAITSVVVVVKREIIIIWIYSKPWGRRLFSEDPIEKAKPLADPDLDPIQTLEQWLESRCRHGKKRDFCCKAIVHRPS